MRLWLAAALGAWLAAGPARAEPAGVAAGIRQVKEGDLEGGVLTLESVVRTSTGDAGRRRDLVRAHLYLGIAKLGLNAPAEAHARFLEALALDPSLRLSRLEFSPRVVAAFGKARREAPPAAGRSGAPGGTLLALGAGGAAAAAGVVVLASGGGDGEPELARFSDARFATGAVVCSNGMGAREVPVTLLLTASNTRPDPVVLSRVDTTLTIVASAFPDEVGLVSRRPTFVTPAEVGPRSTVTLRVDTSLVCINDAVTPERWNSWQAEIAVASNVATATLRSADTLRVEIP